MSFHINKYKYNHDLLKQYSFYNIRSDMPRRKINIIIVINNFIKSLENRIKNINVIYKYINHLELLYEFQKIIIITSIPKPKYIECDNTDDMFCYLFRIPYSQKNNINPMKYVEYVASIYEYYDKDITHVYVEKSNDNYNKLFMNLFTEIEVFNTKWDWISNDKHLSLNYDYPNIFLSIINQNIFNMSNENVGFMNIYDLIVLMNDNNDDFHECTISQLITFMYKLYLSQCDDKIFFKNCISVINEKITDSDLNSILNIINVWIDQSKTNITGTEIIDIYNKKRNIKCIPIKKYLKSIKYLDKNSYAINFMDNIDNKIDQIIDEIDEFDDDLLKKSTEFYYSLVSLTNWKDEIEEKSCMGISANITVPNQCKFGKNTDDIIINVSDSFLSVIDSLNTLCSTENKFDGDINKTTIIDDNVFGSRNFVLPIYINEQHWSIASEYNKILLPLCISGNANVFNDNMVKIYYLALNDIIEKIFKNQNFNNKMINVMFALLRTCMQISYERKIHKGIYKHLSNILKSGELHKLGILSGQLISVGYTDDLEMIKNIIKISSDNKNITSENINTMLCGFAVIDIIKKETGFAKFIIEIDNTNGILSDILYEKIYDNIKNISFNQSIQLTK